MFRDCEDKQIYPSLEELLNKSFVLHNTTSVLVGLIGGLLSFCVGTCGIVPAGYTGTPPTGLRLSGPIQIN